MKMKRLLGVLLTIVLMLGLLPGMGFTAYADVPQEGSNKYVGYRHNSFGFDVYGKREKADGTIEEIQTTYAGYYATVMKVGGNESISFNDFAYGKEYPSYDVKASVTARVRGKGVLVTYTLFNDSDELKTVRIGSYADTQIYNDDEAPCSFTENGIKMTSKDGTLEFQLIPGGGNFTTRWYGKYYEAVNNVFNNRTDTSTYTEDSGIAWSWTIDIPARATITKTAELSAGQVGTKQIIYDANGGTGEMDPTVDIPGESIKLNKNTFTKDDYVFQGWDTNSAGTTVVYADEATLTMPDTDTTLYAVWKENKEITAAAEGFEGAYDGKEHGITVTVTDPSSGATIKYGKTAGTYDLDASPTITNVVDSPLTVYFKVTADGYKDYTGSATVTINKANAVPATVTANNRTYDGAEKSLVTVDDSTLDGGMMQYALGSDATTEPTEGWSTSIPTATNAGTYYVWYKVKGDDNHKDTDPACVTAVIKEPADISCKVTFKVKNGSWNNGKKDDITVTLTGKVGDILKLTADQIPTVGNKPDTGYKEGAWDKTPSTDTAISEDTTYTYTYARGCSTPVIPDIPLVPIDPAWAEPVTPIAPVDPITAQERINAEFAMNGKFLISWKESGKITVTWGKAKKADLYEVYAVYCDTNDEYELVGTTDGTKSSLTFSKLKGRNLKAKASVKVQVKAFRKVGGEETWIATTITGHAVGPKNKTYTNVKKLTGLKSSVTLQKGETLKLKPKITLENSKKKLLKGHCDTFRYISSNSSVLKVAADGTLTALKNGKANVYVFAKNGFMKKIKVFVE